MITRQGRFREHDLTSLVEQLGGRCRGDGERHHDRVGVQLARDLDDPVAGLAGPHLDDLTAHALAAPGPLARRSRSRPAHGSRPRAAARRSSRCCGTSSVTTTRTSPRRCAASLSAVAIAVSEYVSSSNATSTLAYETGVAPGRRRQLDHVRLGQRQAPGCAGRQTYVDHAEHQPGACPRSDVAVERHHRHPGGRGQQPADHGEQRHVDAARRVR